MNRSLLAIVAAAGIVGLTIGLNLSGRPRPKPSPSSTVLAPLPDSTPAPPLRREFPLRPDDVKADRETPAIAVDARGRVLLAFASQTGDLERTIHLARSSDGGQTFSEPKPWRKVPIYKYASKSSDTKPAMTYSTHVLPRLAASGDELVLGWVEAIDGGPRVVYYVARSFDGGATFADPVAVHGESTTRPGFTALAAGPSGELDAAWLDDQKPCASTRRHGSEGFEAEATVYAGPAGAGVCPCCDVALARAEGGPLFVAFRDDDDDHRDIKVSRSTERGFERPVVVGDHRWTFKGCPHDGPALALKGDRLVVAWMDAHNGLNRVYVADSDFASLSFQAHELAPDAKGSQGHPRLALDRKGRVLAAWDESLDHAAPAETKHGHGHAPTGVGRAIRFASTADGRSFGPSRAIDPRPGSFQLNPALAMLDDDAALVAWAELDTQGKRIVVVRVLP
jgi:hypothetical protein